MLDRTLLISALAMAAALPCAAQPTYGTVFATPDAKARLIPGSCGPATYPKPAEQAGHEGTVNIVLTVSDKGTVTDARVAQSSRSAVLDTESRFIGAQCRFTPALKAGKAIYSQVTLPFVWKLDLPALPASAPEAGMPGTPDAPASAASGS